MPHYKLSYFDIRGRAEVARLLFTYAGVEYEDNRISNEDWAAMKPNTPFGHLPVLEVDGKIIGETVAIVNLLAKEFGLYGRNSFENAIVDQVVCLIQDYYPVYFKMFLEEDQVKKAELEKTHNGETNPKYFGFFEKLLKQNNQGMGFFVGDKVTSADIYVFDLLWGMKYHNPSVLDSNPLLKAHFERIGSIESIKAYVTTRKATQL